MDTAAELKKVREEIDRVLTPLKNRERELEKIDEQAFIEKQQAHFKTLEGKLFYGDKTTWGGFKDSIYLIKVVSCDDWSSYNVCKIIQFQIILEKEKFSSLKINKTTDRVSNYETHYKPLTEEFFNTVKELVNNEMINCLIHFEGICKK